MTFIFAAAVLLAIGVVLLVLPPKQSAKQQWAAQKSFEYTKSDAFLTDEWTRGAAAGGVAAKNVVSGIAAGYEVHLVELAGATVMAMRRPVASDVVVDARRNATGSDAEDLMPVTTVGEFRVFSTDAPAAERLIEERVTRAFSALPATVGALWIESDWVLAQFAATATGDDWDATIPVLATLSDAARVLPPHAGAVQPIDLSDCDPSRSLPTAPEKEEEDLDDPEPTLPVVERKEKPVELPTRAAAKSLGVVADREIGDDDVDAIADGAMPKASDFQGPRVIRDLSKGSSIFDDLSAELGRNPLE